MLDKPPTNYYLANVVLDRARSTMKLWIKGEAAPRHVLDCSNATVGPYDGSRYGQYGPCPPGFYYVGDPSPRSEADGSFYIAEGRFFTPLLDPNGYFGGRSDIGVHGGGTASPNPLAPSQGFYPTEGCFRLLNIDNEGIWVPFVRYLRDRASDPDRAILFSVLPLS